MKSKFIPAALLAAAAAFAFGTAQAEGNPVFGDGKGFNDLDTNHDGSLSRSEAAKKPELAAHFKTIDANGDGKLSRTEYLEAMAKKDFNTVREKAAKLIEPNSSSTGSSKK